MRLVKAELRKFVTTRTCIWLLLATVLFAMIPTLVAVLAGNGGPGAVDAPITDPAQQATALGGVAAGTNFIAILGILGVTTEYRYRTMVPTFLATPARYRVIGAKLLSYLLVGIGFAAVAAVFVVGFVWTAAVAKGGTFSLADANGSTLLGAAIASALYGAIGVGLGALIGNQIGAIVALLAYTFIVEGMLAGFSATQKIYAYLPGGASQALYAQSSTRHTMMPFLLPPWAGALLIVGYGVLFAALALLLTTRREVS